MSSKRLRTSLLDRQRHPHSIFETSLRCEALRYSMLPLPIIKMKASLDIHKKQFFLIIEFTIIYHSLMR